uniref:Uncharacterized protein n=1 Tax=viral metagenome TaxID=1070528 RepID=A0A6C0LL80_9ZZZZ
MSEDFITCIKCNKDIPYFKYNNKELIDYFLYKKNITCLQCSNNNNIIIKKPKISPNHIIQKDILNYFNCYVSNQRLRTVNCLLP